MRILAAAGVGNNVIGNNYALPWPKITMDMKRFRTITLGNTVVMGRKTFESIGRPLAKRTNIVLTKDKNFKAPEGVIVVNDIQPILDKYYDSWIIGGQQIYEALFPFATHLFITWVYGIPTGANHKEWKGDTYLPHIKHEEWKIKTLLAPQNQPDTEPYIEFAIYQRRT
jgi:dihydrofolate reductase